MSIQEPNSEKQEQPKEVSNTQQTALGASAGATVGYALGGPAGVVVGALIGSVLAKEEKDSNQDTEELR